jgi:hypothetical protein
MLVVVVDDSPPSLERIFRFLAESSDLAVRLFTVQRYASGADEIFVSRCRVDPRSEPPRSRKQREDPLPPAGPELDKAFKAYNENPFEGAPAEGAALHFRQIRPESLKKRCTYHLFRRANSIGVSMIVRDEALKETARLFDGRPVANGQGKQLVWYESPVAGRSRLKAEFPLDTPAETIAQAMRDLMSMTKAPITEKLQQLYGAEKAQA